MTYRLDLTKRAQEHIAFHKQSGNKSLLNKIAVLLDELTEHPFTGTGKPEPLKHHLSGMWSRRINKEHRLVYEVVETNVVVHHAKGHYWKKPLIFFFIPALPEKAAYKSINLLRDFYPFIFTENTADFRLVIFMNPPIFKKIFILKF